MKTIEADGYHIEVNGNVGPKPIVEAIITIDEVFRWKGYDGPKPEKIRFFDPQNTLTDAVGLSRPAFYGYSEDPKRPGVIVINTGYCFFSGDPIPQHVAVAAFAAHAAVNHVNHMRGMRLHDPNYMRGMRLHDPKIAGWEENPNVRDANQTARETIERRYGIGVCFLDELPR